VSTRAAAEVLVIASVARVAASGRAQASTAEHDDFHERLEDARADSARIQEEAEPLEEQIASIDDQAAAVAGALQASGELVEENQAKFGVLEQEIARKEQIYRRVQKRIEDLAVPLYKADPRRSWRCS
jgi:chromosome segregation ATPase